MSHRNRYRGSPSSESNPRDDWRSAAGRDQSLDAAGAGGPYGITRDGDEEGAEGDEGGQRIVCTTVRRRDQVAVARGGSARQAKQKITHYWR